MDQSYPEVVESDVDESTEEMEVGGVEEEEPPRLARKVSPARAMARAAADRAAARAEEAPAAPSRAWGRDALMVVRRSHLYAGLLLYPWVLLYGITAFLFNHPGAFPDRTIIRFGRDLMKGTALERFPSADDLALKVVASLNAGNKGEPYRLIKPESARFERGGLSATVKGGDGLSYTVSLEPDGGTIRALAAGAAAVESAQGGPETKGARRGGRGGESGAPAGGEGPRRGRAEEGSSEAEGGLRRGRGEAVAEGRGRSAAPFATRELTVEPPPLEAIREALPAVLERAGVPGAKVSEVRINPISFQVEAEGQPWLATCNVQTGVVTGRPVDDPASRAELTTRRFLLRLHTAHGYPSEFGQRWVWALIVDLMAFLMVFWGLSGVIMWWQIKRTRRIGAVALTLSTAAAVWIGVGMHGYFVDGGR